VGPGWGSLVLVITLGGCTTRTPATPYVPQPFPTVQVIAFADASLQVGLIEARKASFGSPHVGLWIDFDASPAQVRRIEGGDRADLLLLEASSLQRLADTEVTSGRPVEFTANRLTVVVPAANPAGLRSVFDLASPGLRVAAAADEAPLTEAAQRLVDRLAGLPEAPPGFAAAYAANIRSREVNVRFVLARVERGEADAAIVYASDARTSPNLSMVQIPVAADIPVRYAGAVIKGAVNGSYGQRFVDFLVGPDGQALLDRNGYLPPT